MQKSRKKVHKEVVYYMRKVNKQILNDEYLGIGRFRLDMYREKYFKYPDCSGGHLWVVFKISDTLTGNWALFSCNNYNYVYHINKYCNDFLIRCSDGHAGHFPPLNYIAYDVHEIVEYAGSNRCWNGKAEDGVLCKYDW